MPPIFASVRCRKLYGFGDLKAAETHASGVGETAEARRVREGPRAIALDLAKGGVRPLDVGESHDIVDRWKILKKHFKARERKGSAIALHLLCIVSPEAFDGDLSDPDNTDGRRLLNAARVWAETEFGKGTVFHARRDLDEEGQCVVDICVAPVRQMRAGRHPPKPTISTRRALEEIAERWNRPKQKSYSALQDSWAEFARKYLNADLQRGRSKQETGREHHHRDQFERIAKGTQEEVEAEIDGHRRRFMAIKKAIRKAQRIYDELRARLDDLVAQVKATEERLSALKSEEGILDKIMMWNRAHPNEQVPLTRPAAEQERRL